MTLFACGAPPPAERRTVVAEPLAPGAAKKAVLGLLRHLHPTSEFAAMIRKAVRLSSLVVPMAANLDTCARRKDMEAYAFRWAARVARGEDVTTVADDWDPTRVEKVKTNAESRFDPGSARVLALTVYEAAGGDEPDPDNGHPHYTCRLCRAEFVVGDEKEPTELCYTCAWEALEKLSAALLSACDETEALRGELAQARAQAVKDCVTWLSVVDESPATARRMAEDVLAGVAPVPPPDIGEPPY